MSGRLSAIRRASLKRPVAIPPALSNRSSRTPTPAAFSRCIWASAGRRLAMVIFVGHAGPRCGEPRQHPFGTAAPQTRRHIEDLSRREVTPTSRARPAASATVHSGYCQLRLPARCSCHAWRTGSTRTSPSAASRAGASRDSAHFPQGTLAAMRRSARQSPSSAAQPATSARSDRAPGAAAICRGRRAP